MEKKENEMMFQKGGSGSMTSRVSNLQIMQFLQIL